MTPPPMLRALLLLAPLAALACQADAAGPAGDKGPAGGKADSTTLEDGVPFMDSETFANGTGCGFERDGAELEATFTVTGLSGKELRELLVAPEGGSGNRTVFERLRKNRDLEAFTYGYDLDEIPWTGDEHDIREDFPFVTLTIEQGRFIPDPDTGELEVDLGTDIMDDAYFDTPSFELLDNQMSLRGRIRWDGPGAVRRLLIAAKFNTTVDANGIKRSEKVDTRTSGGTHRETLFDDVRTGEVPWCGGRQAIEPIKVVYDAMAELDLLPDMEDANGELHEGVLLVEPRVHLRSTRSRLHYDMARFSDVRRFYTNALSRIEDARDDARAALDDPDFDSRYPSASAANAARERVQAVFDQAEALLDGSVVRDAVRAADSSITDVTLPANFSESVSTFEELEANRVTAEVVDELFHDFADLLDDADRDLSGAPANGTDAEDAFDDLGDLFIEWQDDRRQDLARSRTMGPHIADYEGLSDNLRKTFNDFYIDEMTNNAGVLDPDALDPMDDAVWAMLGNQLHLESLKISKNMIEAGGTASHGLWFEQAREFYVPASNRPFGNFLIDTIDMAEVVTPADWQSMDPAVLDDLDQPLPSDVVKEAMLVNEVQIELALEKPYLDRINELQALVDGGSATDEDRRNLDGARFVFETLLDAQTRVAELKEDRIEDVLEDNGAPNNTLRWEPVESSKGDRALELVRGGN